MKQSQNHCKRIVDPNWNNRGTIIKLSHGQSLNYSWTFAEPLRNSSWTIWPQSWNHHEPIIDQSLNRHKRVLIHLPRDIACTYFWCHCPFKISFHSQSTGMNLCIFCRRRDWRAYFMYKNTPKSHNKAIFGPANQKVANLKSFPYIISPARRIKCWLWVATWTYTYIACSQLLRQVIGLFPQFIARGSDKQAVY